MTPDASVFSSSARRVLVILVGVAMAMAVAWVIPDQGTLLAGGLVGVLLFGVMLVYPIAGLFIVVFVTFGLPWELVSSAFGLGTAVRLTAILFAGSFLVRVLMLDLKVQVFSVTALPFFLFVTWRLVQILRTNAPEAAIWINDPGSIPEFILRLVMYGGLYVLLLNVCREGKHFAVVGLAVILPVFLSAGYSLLIYFSLVPTLLGSADNLLTADRIAGLRGNPLETTTILAVAIGLLLPMLVSGIPRNAVGAGPLRFLLGSRWKITVVGVAMIAALFLAGQRSGIIILTALVLGVFATYRVRLARILPTVIVSILLLVYVTPLSPRILIHLTQMPILSELIYGESILDLDTSAAKRYERMMVGPDILRERPLIGAGFGNYELEMAERLGYGSSAHNLYAEVMGEEGLIGLAIYLFLLLRIHMTFVKASRRLQDGGLPMLHLLCSGFMWAFVAFNIDRLFGNGDQINKLIFLFLGMADAFAQYVRRRSAIEPLEPLPEARRDPAPVGS